MEDQDSKIWYVVVDGKADGPYTEKEIKEKLVLGRLAYSDLVFKPGLTKWVPLTECLEFQRRQEPERSADAKTEAKPATAPIPQADQSIIEELTEVGKQPPLQKRRRFMIATSGAIVGMTLAYAGLNAYKQSLEQEKPAKLDRQMASQKNNPPAPPPPAAVAVATPKQPKVLKISGLKLASPNPQLSFETDLPAGSQITVDVEAKSGAILRFPHYQLTKNVTVISSQLPMLDLSSVKLPDGEYTVQATSGELKTETKIFVGANNEAFKKRLNAFKKLVAKQTKSEKTYLKESVRYIAKSETYLTKEYAKLRKTSSINKKKWDAVIRAWKKKHDAQTKFLKTVQEGHKNSFVFPEELLKLKKAQVKLLQLATLFDRTIKTGREIASKTDLQAELKQEVDQLKEMLKQRFKKP